MYFVKELLKTKNKKVQEIVQRKIRDFQLVDCEIEVITDKLHTTVNDNGVVPFIVECNYTCKVDDLGNEFDKKFIKCNKVVISTQSIIKLCNQFDIDAIHYTRSLMACLIENIKTNKDPYNIICVPITL